VIEHLIYFNRLFLALPKSLSQKPSFGFACTKESLFNILVSSSISSSLKGFWPIMFLLALDGILYYPRTLVLRW
jgi:hypothetical protein